VDWIGGGVDILRVDRVNRLITVVEGAGRQPATTRRTTP
jgi:hypothetical protein